MIEREIRQWATRVVDVYSSRVSLTLLQQGELERAVAAEFMRADEQGKEIAEWAAHANAAMDQWERAHPQRGPRIASFSVAAKQVIEKPRRI